MASNFVSNWLKNPFQLWTNLLITVGVGYLIYHVLIKKDISLSNAATGIPDMHSYMKTHGHHYGMKHLPMPHMVDLPDQAMMHHNGNVTFV